MYHVYVPIRKKNIVRDGGKQEGCLQLGCDKAEPSTCGKYGTKVHHPEQDTKDTQKSQIWYL